MSPESSNPNATGDVIVPPTLPGAGSAAVVAGLGEPPPAGATHIAALPELDGFVKATTPLLLRKPLSPGVERALVTVLMGWGLQAPALAMSTSVNPPSLIPMKSPPQISKSIWPCEFSLGTKKSPRMMGLVGLPAKNFSNEPEVPHQVHAAGGVSPLEEEIALLDGPVIYEVDEAILPWDGSPKVAEGENN